MKAIPSILLLGAIAVAPFAGRLTAADSEPNSTSIAFSKPDAPRTVRIENANGEIRVVGADVDVVTVKTSAEPTGQVPRRADGLRVIAANNSFSLTERDNVVSLSQSFGGYGHGGSDFDVTVPRGTSVIVKGGAGGDVAISDLTGDVEVSLLNGSVRLENVAGGVAVDTMNGEISARYAALPAGKSHSFSSMNGEIRLFVPAAAKATFTLRAQNGSVATDFDEKALVTRMESGPGAGPGPYGMQRGKDAALAGLAMAQEAVTAAKEIAKEVEAEKAAKKDRPDSDAGDAVADGFRQAQKAMNVATRMARGFHFPAFGGQVVTGLLNGGGVEIRATTMNGEIQIREAK
jgi:hypothetical protein